MIELKYVGNIADYHKPENETMESSYSPVTDKVQGAYCEHCGRQNADHCAACQNCDAVGTLCSSCFKAEAVQHPDPTKDDLQAALTNLLGQLGSIGIYIPGEDEGQWHGSEGLSFQESEDALGERN